MKRLVVVLLAVAGLALAVGGGAFVFLTSGRPGPTTAAAPGDGKADPEARPAGAKDKAETSAAAPGNGLATPVAQAGASAATASPPTAEQAAAAASTAPAADSAAAAASRAETGGPASKAEVGSPAGTAVAASQAPSEPNAVTGTGAGAPDPRLARVVRLYEGMKPKEAATIIARLEPALGTAIISGMRDRQAARVLGLLPPDKAADITARLARTRTGASTGQAAVAQPRTDAPARAANGRER